MKPIGFTIIETPRLLLRQLTPEIYKQVFASYTTEEQKAFFGCDTGEQLAEEKKKHDDGLSMYKKSLLLFQLIEKSTNKIIGWCGYHTWYLPHYRAEIGYVLNNDEAKGKGYMKEALQAVLDYGFNEMGLKRVEAFVGAGNVPSLKLLKAFCFTEEANLREHYFVNGVMEDSLLFSLLEREYKATAPTEP